MLKTGSVTSLTLISNYITIIVIVITFTTAAITIRPPLFIIMKHVQPLLEYAVCVWSPYQLEDVTKIESVQQRFTKRLTCLSNVS